MSTGPAVVIGPGNVGCGVVAAALETSGTPYVMVARTDETAARVRTGGMRVRRGADPGHGELTLRPLTALSVDDPAFTHVVGVAAVIFVAVGSGQARTLAPRLAAALVRRATPVPVLVCDNRDGGAEALRALVAEHSLQTRVAHRFAGVLVDRIVNRVEDCGGVTTFLPEADGAMYVDRVALDGVVPDVEGLIGVDRFRSHLVRKRFVFSAGHAAAAYLGGLLGHSTMYDALADDDVLMLVRAAMREGQAGIAAACGEDFAGGPADIEAALRRFRNPAVGDTVARVGRDPMRKLGREERICGPARLARAAGASSRALAVTAAAALSWGATLDPELFARCARLGPRGLVSRLAVLGAHDPFVEQVGVAYRDLGRFTGPRAAFERLGGEALTGRGGVRR